MQSEDPKILTQQKSEIEVAPSVYSYFDYRQFLRDVYEFKRKRNPQFSYRAFSRISKFKSLCHMHLIVSGKRDLIQERVNFVANACQLGAQETKYFRALVQWNQCKDEITKSIFFDQLVSALPDVIGVHQLNQNDLAFLSHWKILALREMMRLPGFQCDYGWVATRFRPGITEMEFKKAISSLKAAGLITLTEAGGVSVNHRIISKPVGLPTSVSRLMQMEMLKFAGASINTTPVENRMQTTVTFCLDRKRVEEVKEKIRTFTKELLKSYDGDLNSNEVYQLSMLCVPITNVSETTKGSSL